MPTSARWMRPVLLFASALLAAPATAQVDDSFADEPAYMARLANKSMLLDGALKPSGGMVAVGERGHILLSADGGNNWTQSPVPTRSSLTSVYFLDDNNGWAVGHDTLILRTTDGGSSWTKVNFDPASEMPLFGVLFIDERHGFAVGAYGLYMTSSDGGISWSTEDLSPVRYSSDMQPAEQSAGELDEDFEDEFEFFDYHLNHITSDATGRLYIASEAGHFFRSQDQGANWIAMNTPYEGSYYATLPLGGDRLLLCGMRGHLLRSDDAGVSLQEVETGTLSLLSGGIVLDNAQVLVVGMAGTLLVSSDNGSTFSLTSIADRKGLSTALNAGGGAVVLLGEVGVQRRAASEFGGGQQ